MVKTTTTKKKAVKSAKSTVKKTAPAKVAKAAVKKAKAPVRKIAKKKTVIKKSTKSSYSVAKKAPTKAAKTVTTKAGKAVKIAKVTSVASAVKSPIRKVETVAQDNEKSMTGSWLMIIIATIVFVVILGLWTTRSEESTDYNTAPDDSSSSYSEGSFSPSVNIGN